MTDPGLPLQIAYATLLAGFQVGGIPVPMHDSLAPDKASAPYIIFTRAETLNASTKNSFGHKLSVTLDVVTRFGPGPVSSLPVDGIANALLALLFPSPNATPLVVAGFALWRCSLQGVRPMTTRTPTDTLVRRLITIIHELHPL